MCDITEDTFDWEFYINIHPDLKAAGIKDKKCAFDHYLTHGIKECRAYKLINKHYVKNVVNDDIEICEDNTIQNDIDGINSSLSIPINKHGIYKLKGRTIFAPLQASTGVEKKTIAVLFHVGNFEIFQIMIDQGSDFFQRKNMHIIITTNQKGISGNIKAMLPASEIYFVENQGMDVGGWIKALKILYSKESYKNIKYIYKFHTKTDGTWRNGIYDPLIKNYKKIETYDNSDKILMFGGNSYIYRNNKDINRIYVDQIMERNSAKFDKFVDTNLSTYRDEYWNINKEKMLVEPEMYKFYEQDLKDMSDLECIEHYFAHGINESHRIHNSNIIKKFNKETYFVAGTIFCATRKYYDLFKNINFDNEFNILEKKYVINDIPRKTHAWEYFFGTMVYLSNSHIVGVTNDGIFLRYDKLLDKYNTGIYRECNFDLAHFDDNDLMMHYIENGINEGRIYNFKTLMKPQCQLNDRTLQAPIAFFMLLPTTDATSGGYITLLHYINVLIKNGIYVDMYFGNSTIDMKRCKGFTIMRDSVSTIIENIKRFNILSDLTKVNFFVGLTACKKYNMIVANAWQISESVYLNKNKCDNLLYIIQDLEALFYPNDLNMQKSVCNTYKPEFNYYCITEYLYEKFKEIMPNSKIYKSFLGVNTSLYENKKCIREKSIILAYYTFKPGRKHEMVEKIIEALYKQYKLYIFPEDYTKIVDPNIVNLGKKTPKELNIIYNTATIGVVFSNTNPSRLGFEMVASGLKVIEYSSEFTNEMPNEIFTKIKNHKKIVSIVDKLFDKEIDAEQYVESISIEKDHKNFLNFVNNFMPK